MVRTDSKVQTLDAFVQTEHHVVDEMESENNNNDTKNASKNKLPPLLKFPGGIKNNQQNINIDDEEEEEIVNSDRDLRDQASKKAEMQKKRFFFPSASTPRLHIFESISTNSSRQRIDDDDTDFESGHQAKKTIISGSEEDFEAKKKLESKDTTVLYETLLFFLTFSTFRFLLLSFLSLLEENQSLQHQ